MTQDFYLPGPQQERSGTYAAQHAVQSTSDPTGDVANTACCIGFADLQETGLAHELTTSR